MTPDRVKDRIRKLLALADDDGAAEGEIENALRFADKLMSEHQIDRGDLNEAEAAEIMARVKEYTIGARLSTWETSVAWAVSRTCGVPWYRARGEIVRIHGIVQTDPATGKPIKRAQVFFYGPAEDIEIAANLFHETCRLIASMARLRYGGVFRGSGRSYAEGFAKSLHQKATMPAAPGEDRALAIRRTEIVRKTSAIAKRWLASVHGVHLSIGSRSGGNRQDGEAYGAGRADGRKHSMSSGRRGRLGGGRKGLPGS